ncbi:MAG: efflux RND transporter periplasmic adaptor subunit [Gammaproteobacteria bacterium]|jgi:multidrug efflux system membrane fusion protein|nr:efflux RND transporter periplasmic adaptor subunit [Gammaproteobacteria bacterium]MBT4378696.1 efflux RND transporter periplasmic adaptor subunit [Gammaproteobacteria bacterium]MBT4615311.1 efflux RND transporter periplasmic adaptor subunit [Gammaproteobacteria bacterium]MBT5445516.1 efflux RND transporter periplasmic adaptor subunit [Gammaproteobacteria bacterium]MBT5792323.1 efflux RND transporter periplasmic adaptor subunit [Gammaproteobacteria bacterium]
MQAKYWVSTSIVMLILAWLLAGHFLSVGTTAQALTVPEAETQTQRIERVRGVLSRAQPRRTHMSISGRTAPNRVVNVRTEIAARIVKLYVEKGDRVAADQPLCKLATGSRNTSLSKAIALERQTLLEHRGMMDLSERGLQSEIAIARSRTRLESAQHDVSFARLQLSRVEVKSPFAGIVENQPVEEGDVVAIGGICATMLDLDPILIVGRVAEKDIGFIQPGQELTAHLLTGEAVTGRISFVSHAADDTTRSYLVEAEVPNTEGKLRAGITAEIQFITGTKVAHQVDPAALVLNDSGDLGVRTVDDKNIVGFHTVSIVSEGAEGLWVTGLAPEVRLITVGQEMVGAGQEVELVLSSLPGQSATDSNVSD